MKKILVIAGPGGGHYYPIAGFLKKLTGDYKIYVTAQISQQSLLAQQIAADHFEFISLDVPDRRSKLKKVYGRLPKLVLTPCIELLASLSPVRGLPGIFCRFLFGILSYSKDIASLEWRAFAIEDLFKTLRPDFVFADFNNHEGVDFLCAKYNSEWIEYTVCPVNTSLPGRPVYPCGFSPSLKGGEGYLNEMIRAIREGRDSKIQKRFKELFPGIEAEKPFLKLAFSAGELDDYPEARQNDYLYAGYYLKNFQTVSKTPAQDEKKGIFVSLGSGESARTKNQYYFIVQALKQSGRPVYLRIMDRPTQDEIRNYLQRGNYERFTVLEDSIRYPSELNCGVVVSHGGYNTVKESLYFGIPVLLLPLVAGDRMEVARRVSEKKAGICLNAYRLDARVFNKAVEDLLRDPETGRNVRQIGARLADETRQGEILKKIESRLK